MLERVASIPVGDEGRVVAKLMEAFWPGPLTLLLPRTAEVPDAVTAGRPLVGVRMPAHPVALELIRRAGVPVAAPSANRFGRTSPTTAAHVLEDLDGRIDAVLDGGADEVGVESTVLDWQRDGDLQAGSGDGGDDLASDLGRGADVSGRRSVAVQAARRRRCLRRGWGCGITLRGRGWCWWRGSGRCWRRLRSTLARRLE